jgi:hypothetical protein
MMRYFAIGGALLEHCARSYKANNVGETDIGFVHRRKPVSRFDIILGFQPGISHNDRHQLPATA